MRWFLDMGWCAVGLTPRTWTFGERKSLSYANHDVFISTLIFLSLNLICQWIEGLLEHQGHAVTMRQYGNSLHNRAI